MELTGGCQGFATKYLDWPEELIVGETVKNRSGIIRRCGFLSDQTVCLYCGANAKRITNQSVELYYSRCSSN